MRHVIGFACLLVVAGCTSDPPPPVPRTDDGPALLYVAVGAGDTAGIGADDVQRDAWPAVLHRTALPRASVALVAASPDASVMDQLDLLPVRLREDLATVSLGITDIRRGTPADVYERGLESLVTELRSGGRTRVLMSNTPPLDALPGWRSCVPGEFLCPGSIVVDPSAVNAYNDAVARVAQRTGAEVVDIHGLVLRARAEGRGAELISADGLHPSTAGHAAIAEAFAAVLGEDWRPGR